MTDQEYKEITIVDRHIAKKTMRLKNSNYCLSFVTTIWKGEVVICFYNNITKELADIMTIQPMLPQDFHELETMIGEHIFGRAAKAI